MQSTMVSCSFFALNLHGSHAPADMNQEARWPDTFVCSLRTSAVTQEVSLR